MDPITAFALAQQSLVAPASSAVAAPATSSNMVSNAGFESGMADWINWGNASPVPGQASSGATALSVGSGAGGAGQEVPGIVPGNTYRLTAQAKVSVPSEIVYVGVNFIDASGASLTQNAAVVASTTYTTATVDVLAPPNAARALVYAWKNAGDGLAFVDDFAFGVTDSGVPHVVTSGNMLFNPGFDTPGFVGWQSLGNPNPPTTDAAAGPLAARIGTGAGGVAQQVPGLAPGSIVPGKTYRLSAQVKVSTPGEIGYLGVIFEDADFAGLLAQNVVFRSSSYSLLQADFTAPPNASRAQVFAWKNAGEGFIMVDEVSLVETAPVPPGSEPPPSTPPTVLLSGSPGHVLDTRLGNHANVSIARLVNGTYASAWLLRDSSASDAAYRVCYGISQFHANGTTIGPTNCLQQPMAAWSMPTHVLPRRDGGFVVVWTDAIDHGVRSQAFDASATPVGGVQNGPQQPVAAEAAALADGSYVVLSVAPQSSILTSTISFQRYSSDGTPIGSPTSVGDSGGFGPEIVPLATGGFAVAWMQGGTLSTVMTRMFTADGTPVGQAVVAAGTRPVCTTSPDPQGGTVCGFQGLGGLTAMDDGGYAVAWFNGVGLSGAIGPFIRRFRADGTPGTAVGKLGDGVLRGNALAPAGPDGFVFAWLVDGSGAGDDIVAQRFDATPLR